MFPEPAQWRRVDLPGADVTIHPGWMNPAGADDLLHELTASLPWEVHRIRIFGRMVDSPRLSAWIGDANATYTYSGTRFPALPWTPALALLRDRVAEACGARFNSVLANLYRDGTDSMGWHSDDEPELGPHPVIGSLTLGATRTFRFRDRATGKHTMALDLESGSLLRMAGQTQSLYRHDLPRRARAHGPRINLTFRQIDS
nr:alpha-ketoglutarate-dependent dioxygenase AlkB [Luteibacter sp. Sphag1AF]